MQYICRTHSMYIYTCTRHSVTQPLAKKILNETLDMKKCPMGMSSFSLTLLPLPRFSLTPLPLPRFSSLTPGEQCQTIHRARLVMQPSLPATRKLLSQQYSLPSTADSRMPRGSKVAAGKLYSGGTIPPLTILPHSHRKNVMVCMHVVFVQEHHGVYMYLYHYMRYVSCDRGNAQPNEFCDHS